MEAVAQRVVGEQKCYARFMTSPFVDAILNIMCIGARPHSDMSNDPVVSCVSSADPRLAQLSVELILVSTNRYQVGLLVRQPNAIFPPNPKISDTVFSLLIIYNFYV